MANIYTTTNYFARGSARFELTPNAPTRLALVDTYQMRLWVHDQLVYEAQHSVRNWQMRHFYVSEIARACRCVRQLVDQTIDGPADEYDRQRGPTSFLSFVHAVVSTDWLTVSLAAVTLKQQELVHMNLYLRKSHRTIGDTMRRSRGQWGEWDEGVAATLFARTDEVEGFGIQLQHEIELVEQARSARGIPEYDAHEDEDEHP